jgi:hypothetical protein
MVGEVIGFGLAAAIGAAVGGHLASASGMSAVLLAIGLVVAVGLVEGSAVGAAQWLVLRSHLERLGPSSWVSATVAGAILAWGAGMAMGSVGSQLVGKGEVGGSALMWIAGPLVIGAVAGTLLASVQWWLLRRVGYRASWWIPAHAIGWGGGMLIAFAGISAVPDDAAPVTWVIAGGGIGLTMGLVAAMVSGLALVALLHRRSELPGS